MCSELYGALAQRFDQARVEEARNTPTITLVERAVLAPRPDRRWLIYKGVLSIVGGLALAALFVLGRTMLVRTSEAEADASRELGELWVSTLNKQPALVRRLLLRTRP